MFWFLFVLDLYWNSSSKVSPDCKIKDIVFGKTQTEILLLFFVWVKHLDLVILALQR